MSSSTGQTQDGMAGEHRFGHDHENDDVLEGQLIEPAPDQDRADDDPDSPVDDPIVMDSAPVDPEDDRVVLDSHDDPQAASTPATPAAAGVQDGDGVFASSGDRFGADHKTTASAIPMPGAPADDSAFRSDATMDDDAPVGDADLATGVTPADEVTPVAETAPVTETARDGLPPVGEDAAPADGPAPSAESDSGTSVQAAPGDESAVPSRSADTEQWHEILAMFVDDPRAATERAASLVDSRVEALLASVKDQQQSLQSDWQGDGADT
ncbi:MAG: hypothetical protein ABJB47_02535, partial [Actinomycetota bacterium]